MGENALVKDAHTRNSVLYLTLMSGSKDLIVDVIRVLKVQSKFIVVEEEGIVAVEHPSDLS